MSAPITTAMILAAGRGTRMRAHANDPPKPLVEIAGQSLLTRMIDRLQAAGIERIIINLHHKAAFITAHLQARTQGPEIIFADETQALLDTGGGVKNALPLLGAAPFVVCNADVLWQENSNNIAALMADFDAQRMDVLLLMADKASSTGYDGYGDYCLIADGQLRRRLDEDDAAIFSGVRIVTPQAVAGIDDTVFSFNAIFDAAEARQRLFGRRLDGRWMHVGTPEGRAEAEAIIG